MAQINFVNFHIVLWMAALAILATVNGVQILKSVNKLLPNNKGYVYGFRLGDGHSRFEIGMFQPDANGDLQLSVSGSYQYVNRDNGQYYTVSYTADKNGFHPTFPDAEPLGVYLGGIRYG